MISGQNSQILNLIAACTTAIGTIITDQRPVTEEEEVCVGVEEGPASVASETVNMPSIARKFKGLPFIENL